MASDRGIRLGISHYPRWSEARISFQAYSEHSPSPSWLTSRPEGVGISGDAIHVSKGSYSREHGCNSGVIGKCHAYFHVMKNAQLISVDDADHGDLCSPHMDKYLNAPENQCSLHGQGQLPQSTKRALSPPRLRTQRHVNLKAISWRRVFQSMYLLHYCTY